MQQQTRLTVRTDTSYQIDHFESSLGRQFRPRFAICIWMLQNILLCQSFEMVDSKQIVSCNRIRKPKISRCRTVQVKSRLIV